MVTVLDAMDDSSIATATEVSVSTATEVSVSTATDSVRLTTGSTAVIVTSLGSLGLLRVSLRDGVDGVLLLLMAVRRLDDGVAGGDCSSVLRLRSGLLADDGVTGGDSVVRLWDMEPGRRGLVLPSFVVFLLGLFGDSTGAVISTANSRFRSSSCPFNSNFVKTIN